MFDPVDTRLDLVDLERRVLTQWRDDKVFERSLEQRAGAQEWVFYEGPPTANGRPGIHHVWARLFKDLFPRFHTMRGKYVARKGGWDCHGLPVEVEVEKELGFSGKPQIEEFGIEEFNRRCRESVLRYVGDFEALTSRIGMWLDTDDAYWTLDNDYIESVWWLFDQMWSAGDIYEGFKVVPYCGRCGTALSSHELGQPGAYRDLTEASVYVRFPVLDRDFDLLVWTTTPWTLISNVAAAVGPDLEYVRARRTDGAARDVVLAATRFEDVLGDGYEIVERMRAQDLVGLHYERPFEFLPLGGDACRVVAADFVTVDDGSGIVHLAPAFGEIDREVAEREGLPVLNPVGPQARFDDSVPPWRDQFVKDADSSIIEALAASGRLERVVDYTHSYPHCWRCGTPLIYWAKPTWFARTSEHRDELLSQNEGIGWHPEHIKHGRFGDWLENNVDWALSRDRFWGTPLPVWRCTNRHDTSVGSVARLGELAGKDLAGLDLHRPYVDDVEITCAQCSAPARRVEPVLDAWFDSGSMPSAQFHFPFENEETFARRFPADFICEAIDQTRGWFYSLLAVNTLVFKRSPYRNVVCLGLVVDRDGQKMSKSRGNVIDPWTILDTRGADALRWYFFSAGSPWISRRVYEEGIDESTRSFLLTLWNTYAFFVTYANLDGWTPDAATAGASAHVLDRWIRSRLHRTVAEVTDALEAFDALHGAQALEALVDDLSNWYVRRSRARFWNSADAAAHATLHEILTTIARLLAPYTPFVADDMWQNLARTNESVHLQDWPTVDASAIDDRLEEEMTVARHVASLGLAARNDARLKVRQPLRRVIVLLPDQSRLSSDVVAEIADELNVKELEPVDNLEGLLDYRVTPNFRKLGPKFGKDVQRVKAALEHIDGSAVRQALDTEGVFRLDLGDGTVVDLAPDELDVRAESHEELVLVQEDRYAVALDTTLDDELRREGWVRELVRAINEARKQRGLEIADRIALTLTVPAEWFDATNESRDLIAGEVLAKEITVESGTVDPNERDTVTLDGVVVRIAFEKR